MRIAASSAAHGPAVGIRRSAPLPGHHGSPPLQRRRSVAHAHAAITEASSHAHLEPDVPRRQCLASLGASLVLGTALWLRGGAAHPLAAQAAEEGIQVLSDEPGFGTRAAQKGDLLLLHYTGVIKETGAVFDSTKGGLMYRDGGMGVFRPYIIRLGGDPVPGVCRGLRLGLEGMRIGGKRSFEVPPELGFRRQVLAPYALVPEGATLVYEVELIRLSARGPDELTKGIERCGQGGAAQQVSGCTQIEPKEFLL